VFGVLRPRKQKKGFQKEKTNSKGISCADSPEVTTWPRIGLEKAEEGETDISDVTPRFTAGLEKNFAKRERGMRSCP